MHAPLLDALVSQCFATRSMDCAVHEKLDELGHHDTNGLHTHDKGVTSTRRVLRGLRLCCSILCTVVLVDGLFDSLRLKNADHGCNLDSRRASLENLVMQVLLFDACLVGILPRGPCKHRWSFFKALGPLPLFPSSMLGAAYR